MKTREQKLWDNLKPHLPGDVARVENVAYPGFPDANGCYTGWDYWIELKAPTTVNYEVDDLLEDSQRVWINKRLRQGAKVLVIVRNGHEEIFVHNTTTISSTINGYPILGRFPKPYDWTKFENLILSRIVK